MQEFRAADTFFILVASSKELITDEILQLVAVPHKQKWFKKPVNFDYLFEYILDLRKARPHK